MADRGLPSEAPVVTTSPAGPPSDGRRRSLASLAGLRQPPTPTAETANGWTTPAFLATAMLCAAMAAFLLSGTAIAPADARACWRPLLEHLCALHRAHGLPETALLAENLPGLLVHRLVVALPEAPDQAFREMEVIKDTILAVTGSDTSHALDSAGLRTAAALGAVRVRQCAVEWIDRWQTVTKSCLAMSPRPSIEALGETSLKMAPVPLGQPSANLTTPAYSLLFPAPFVQEGLRFLALVSNRVTLFSAHLQRIDDATLTPLTRALFTLALVDEYLTTPERGAVVPPPLLAQFQHTVREIDPAIMIPPLEANKMVRSREEVRVSTALSRVSPRSACAPPGTLMARVRTDVAVFDPDVPFLSPSALAVFQPAVSSLLQLGEQPSTGAQQRLLALLQQTWTLIQNTNSPSVVINTLIDAGFTPSHCTHYLSALEGFLAAGVPARTPAGHGLGEVQQLFGCIALAGSNVFGLAREYGYYANYVKTFRRVQGASEHTHGRLCEAVGLSGGVLSQTLARIMGPAVPTEHLASLRRALVGEFETAERRFSSGQPSLLRETALIWIDVYGQTHWDITPTTPATPLSALLPVGQPSHAPSVHLAAATQIRFPALEGIHPNVLADPGFVPYVLALVVGDALRATCSAAYLPRPVEFALRVLAWARDFGLGYLPTVEGHRTKLGALITLLEPAARGGLGPTMQMADNIEQLLRELYVISRGAVEQLRPLVQLQPPAPEVGTSLLLISMYALAARKAQDSAERADPLIRQLEDAIVLLRLHMRTLSAFFECRFESDGRRLYAVVGDSSDRWPWPPEAMGDAVSQYCSMYHDAKRALVASLASLRSVITETTAHLGVCDELAAQVSHEDNVLAVVRREIHGFLSVVSGIHARASKLLSGDQVPGFCFMGQFLARWRRLSACYQAARAAAGPEPVAEFVQELHDTWKGLQTERTVVVAPLVSSVNRAPRPSGEVMAHAFEDAPAKSAADRVVLTSRRDLGAWGDYSLGPLGQTTAVPDSVDLSRQGLAVTLSMDWLLMNELLRVTDGVFRASAFRPLAGPESPRDLEVRDAGNSLPAPTPMDAQKPEAYGHGPHQADREGAPHSNTPVEDDEMIPEDTVAPPTDLPLTSYQ
ncbi:tegument protein UL37 [Human alphaherpesvirus 1]|nr:tegument protein UL37 [Human alphaherpesvirus 1]